MRARLAYGRPSVSDDLDALLGTFGPGLDTPSVPLAKPARRKLNASERAAVVAFASAGWKVSDFFASLVERDFISENQHAILIKWRGYYPRVIAGMPARNRYAGCWYNKCSKKPTVNVQGLGVCKDHEARARRDAP